jgi:hypothetical protein
MNAKLAPSAAPANAIRIWADSTRIYAELPGAVPCILAFTRDGAGLSKVLNLIYARESSGQIHNPTLPKRTLVGTVSQHTLAEAILRRNRIIR